MSAKPWPDLPPVGPYGWGEMPGSPKFEWEREENQRVQDILRAHRAMRTASGTNDHDLFADAD